MDSRSHSIPPEAVNSLLKDVQHGSLPDISTLSDKYGLYPSLELGDILLCYNRHGDTPLLVAARHGHVHILRALHEDFNISLDHCNMDGKRALHEAAQNGQIDCIRYLTQAGSNVDCLKKADWTPLMLACTKDSLATVEALVSLGASLMLTNKDGWNSFHIACREGHVNIVQFLLETEPSPCDWDTVSKNGRTPLHTAALHGRLDVVKILKERDCYVVDYVNDHIRCSYEPNSKDSCGVIPLMDSSRGDNASTTEFLLETFGAQIDIEDSLGRQAIHHAAQAGATNALLCLIEHGADVNKNASVNHLTPLHYAAKEGQAEAVFLLLEHGADVMATDKKGRTALDLAKNARDSTRTVLVLENFSAKTSLT